MKEGTQAPENWEIVEKVGGDITKDGIPDLVMIVDPRLPDPLPDGYDDPPRGLVFLNGTKHGDFRVLGVGACALYRGYSFFEVETTLNLDAGVLVVTQGTMMSAGGWGTTGVTERWRVEKDTPRLIGFTMNWGSRNSGKGRLSDQNLITGKREISTYSDYDEESPDEQKVLREKPRFVKLEDFILDDETAQIDSLLYKEFPPKEDTPQE
jgi:hypothetical protein